jgi:hypothetical protein
MGIRIFHPEHISYRANLIAALTQCANKRGRLANKIFHELAAINYLNRCYTIEK